ncbi:uncharacterized protein LOC144112803 [Amblyomma americanum]
MVVPSSGYIAAPLESVRLDGATQQLPIGPRGERRDSARTTHAALWFAVVALVFVAGMALLASGLHWWGLCLLGAALLLLVSLCLLPATAGRQPEAAPLAGEPVPVSMCAHLQLRTISGNAVPYLLEEVTLADVSRMYPPPFPPPPYQAKATDPRKK